jgi:hypothetical protein
MTTIKGVQKNGIIWAIEHAFVSCVIYEQCVPSMSIKVNTKKCQGFCGKLACQVYLAWNANFACKIPGQTLWKHV